MSKPSLKNLVAPIIALEWMQIDTPSDSFQPVSYESDKRKFAGLPKSRRSFIRIENPGEFDLGLNFPARMKAPLLRILVIRLAPGIHVRIPVYRGTYPADFDVSSDAEIGIILAGMVRKRGMNYEECLTYEAQRAMEANASEAIN